MRSRDRCQDRHVSGNILKTFSTLYEMLSLYQGQRRAERKTSQWDEQPEWIGGWE